MVNILNRSEMVMNNEYPMDIIKRRELAINALCDMDTDRKFEFRIDAFLQNVKREEGVSTDDELMEKVSRLKSKPSSI